MQIANRRKSEAKENEAIEQKSQLPTEDAGDLITTQNMLFCSL